MFLTISQNIQGGASLTNDTNTHINVRVWLIVWLSASFMWHIMELQRKNKCYQSERQKRKKRSVTSIRQDSKQRHLNTPLHLSYWCNRKYCWTTLLSVTNQSNRLTLRQKPLNTQTCVQKKQRDRPLPTFGRITPQSSCLSL